MEFETIIGNDIALAAKWLQDGELVAIPTETVYGLAANGLDEDCVSKIFIAKQRPKFDPLILHVPNIDAASALVRFWPKAALQLAKLFWPGPLTLVLPKNKIVPDLVTSGMNSVAIRIPAHPMAQELLNSVSFPLAAPSANPFGYISPTTAEHVYQQLQGLLPYILDGGSASVGVESTIIGFEHNEVPIVYRFGGLSLEQIENAIGLKVKVLNDKEENPSAPGMLKSHYAPSVPMIDIDDKDLVWHKKYITYKGVKYPFRQMGYLGFDKLINLIPVKNQKILSPKSNVDEAAMNLFAAMRTLDNSSLSLIIAAKFPDIGLGKAINDRIKRACHS